MLDAASQLPSASLVGVSIFDLDKGPNGECDEGVRAADYAYYATPLRATTGEPATSTTLLVNRASGSFDATARGSAGDNPSDPRNLTAAQASKAVQIFYQPRVGFVEMTCARHGPRNIPCPQPSCLHPSRPVHRFSPRLRIGLKWRA
jgi:hypothetical protein